MPLSADCRESLNVYTLVFKFRSGLCFQHVSYLSPHVLGCMEGYQRRLQCTWPSVVVSAEVHDHTVFSNIRWLPFTVTWK